MGGKGKTTQTSGASGSTANLQNQIYQAGQGAQWTPAMNENAASNQATAGYQAAQAAGLIGDNALATGNYSAYMNPYQSSVINSMLQNFGQMASGVTNQANSQATAAGAFGGSRSGVMAGNALGSLMQTEGSDLSNLEYQGFQNATQQALQAANLGMGANAGLQQQGSYAQQLAMEQAAYHQNMMEQAMQGGGAQQTTTTQQSQPNYLNAALGLAGLAAAPFIGGASVATVPQLSSSAVGASLMNPETLQQPDGSMAPIIGGEVYAPSISQQSLMSGGW